MTHETGNISLTIQAEQRPLPAALLRERTAAFAARATWTRAELLAFQQERLDATLRHAAAHSAYYAGILKDHLQGGAPFTSIPSLPKRKFMENFDAVVTDKRLNRAMIEAHVDGPDAGTLLLGEYRALATGGTSGERAVFVYNEDAWANVMAVIGRSQRILGVTPETRSVGIGAPSPIHASNRYYIESRASRPGSPRLDITMPIEEVVSALNSYQPEAITTYPSFIRILAREQAEGRLRISPRTMRSGAEMLLPEVERLVEETWGIHVYNGYASTEAGLMGFQCLHRQGLHLAEDSLLYEVVDDDNQPVADGVEGAKCLITTLGNPVLPLIRYELSDISSVSADPCPCGLPFAQVMSITGRREDVLTFPGPDGKTVTFGSIVLKSPLIAMEGIGQFQIRHQDHALHVNIVPAPGFDADALRARVAALVASKLTERGVLEPNVSVDIVPSISRVGPAAKEKQFVRVP